MHEYRWIFRFKTHLFQQEQFIKEKALREEAEFKVAALAVEIESADQMIDSLELALMRATEVWG